MACVTADEVRAIVDVTAARGWTNAKIETRIGWSENKLRSRLARAFGVALIDVWLAASPPPDLVKQIVLWLTAAEIYREVYGYRTAEGEENPGAVWANEARAAIKDLSEGNAAVIDASGNEHWATTRVLHDCDTDTSIFGGVAERYPYVEQWRDE